LRQRAPGCATPTPLRHAARHRAQMCLQARLDGATYKYAPFTFATMYFLCAEKAGSSAQNPPSKTSIPSNIFTRIDFFFFDDLLGGLNRFRGNEVFRVQIIT